MDDPLFPRMWICEGIVTYLFGGYVLVYGTYTHAKLWTVTGEDGSVKRSPMRPDDPFSSLRQPCAVRCPL